jgi:hypothetical protein
MVVFVRLLTTKNPVSDEAVARVWLVNARWSERPAWAGVKLSGNLEAAAEDVVATSIETINPAARTDPVLLSVAAGDRPYSIMTVERPRRPRSLG